MSNKPNGIKINYEDLFSGHGMNDENTPSVADLHEVYTSGQVQDILTSKLEELKKTHQAELHLAKKQAYEDGEKAGRNQTEKKLIRITHSVNEAIERTESVIHGILEDVKPHVASLVFDVVEKVLEIPFENEAIQNKVKEQINGLLNVIDANVQVKIEISSADYDVVKDLIEQSDNARTITLQHSDDLKPGEFRMDTNKEQIVKQFRKNLADFRGSFSLMDNNES
ncbi:MAG: FliH/SctL family protein [Balneolaceae bacterium]